MSVIGNQRGATYKKEVVLEFISKYPKATTMAIARLIQKAHPIDFTIESARGNVRRYRGENGKNSSNVSILNSRTDDEKKQAMN